MKEIKDYGYLINDNGIIKYEGGYSSEGICYKDSKAFNSGKGICYISEYELNEMDIELTNLESIYENSDMTDKEYEEERMKIINDYGETYQTIIDKVKYMYQEDYMLTEKQIKHIATCIFNEAEWACIDTYLSGDFWLDDDIIFDEGKEMYNQHQYEAVMHNMFPCEYNPT